MDTFMEESVGITDYNPDYDYYDKIGGKLPASPWDKPENFF